MMIMGRQTIYKTDFRIIIAETLLSKSTQGNKNNKTVGLAINYK